VLFLLGAGLNAFPTFWRADGQSALWDASRSDPLGIVAFPGKELSQVAPGAVASNLVAIGLLAVLGVLLLTNQLSWLTIQFTQLLPEWVNRSVAL